MLVRQILDSPNIILRILADRPNNALGIVSLNVCIILINYLLISLQVLRNEQATTERGMVVYGRSDSSPAHAHSYVRYCVRQTPAEWRGIILILFFEYCGSRSEGCKVKFGAQCSWKANYTAITKSGFISLLQNY